MTDELTDLARSIDAKLGALLAIYTHQLLIESDLAQPRPRSIDRMLHDVGLTQAQIAAVLGKSTQAVSQMLAKG